MSGPEFDEAAAAAFLQTPAGPVRSGVTRILAAADRIEARIVEAEKTRTALEEIRRLHGTVTVDALVVCAICCLDVGGVRHDECVDSHEHTSIGPGCSTTEIIARAGL